MDKAYIPVIITVVLLIIYAIILAICHARKVWIFAPYKAPPAPSNAFYPLDGVTPLSPKSQATRKALYTGQA